MMSRKLLTAVANLALVCAWLPMAHAQQPGGTKYVVLNNVAAIPTQPQVGNKAAIPMMPNTVPQIDAAGNFVVTCDLAAGKCPSVGTGDVNLPAAPNVSLVGPSAAVTTTGSSLTWSVPAARTCYGISATKVSPPTSGPSVTGWVQAWPATGGSYSLNTLFNALPADGIEYTYEFKLGCYSTASTVVNQTTVVAYTEAVRQVKLQKGTGGGGGGGSDYCSEYYPPGHPARSQPGFGGAGLVKVERQFNQIFSVGTGAAKTIQQVIDEEVKARGAMSSPEAGLGQYLAVAFTISDQTPDLTGVSLTFVEPQGYQGLYPATKWELSVSPCPGDFRARPALGQDNPTDLYDRRACHKPNDGINITTGTGTGPGSPNSCFAKPGATMYLNITTHDLNTYRATGVPPADWLTVWGCKPTELLCGKKWDVDKTTGF